MKLPKVLKTRWVLAVVAFLCGILLILGIRFVTYHPAEATHYHANLAVYINGQREEFDNPYYYQEVATSCNIEHGITPDKRVHMHDDVNSVIHVHDEAVTWGAFFQNIGWVVDPRVIRSHDTLYLPDEQNKIRFILNGKEVDGAMREVINDEDRLLVDYGNTSATALQKESKSVPATAHKYDISTDPKSCGGNSKPTTGDRFKHLF